MYFFNKIVDYPCVRLLVLWHPALLKVTTEKREKT